MTPSQTSELEELITEILKLVSKVHSSKVLSLNGDQLSAISFKLSTYKVYLGEQVALARLTRDNAEANYIAVREKSYKKFRDRGMTQGDSDSSKRIEAEPAMLELNQAQYNYERLRHLYMDCHDIIESIRSRLIQFQAERSES